MQYTDLNFGQDFPLNKYCSVLEDTKRFGTGKYYNPHLIKKLENFDPEWLILSGFFIPSNLVAYWWAKSKGVKVAVLSEAFWVRPAGTKEKIYQNWLFARYFLKALYPSPNLLFAIGNAGVTCFQDKARAPITTIVKSNYPVDIENHLNHPSKGRNDGLMFLFPHRLIEIYNPLKVIDWFYEINKKQKMSKLKMNAFGHLKKKVCEKIRSYKLEEYVEFLEHIESWDALHTIYSGCDVLLSTKSMTQSDWSIAEIECFASGMGVIANDSSKGMVEALREQESGFVIDDLKQS